MLRKKSEKILTPLLMVGLFAKTFSSGAENFSGNGIVPFIKQLCR
jgi:hypothetical protein